MNYKLYLFGLIFWLLGYLVTPSLALANEKHDSSSNNPISSYLKSDSSAGRCDPEDDCYRDPPTSPDIPHIITPSQRLTVYDSNPILRWQPVEEALEYTVQIRGPGVNWEKNVEGNQWWYKYDGPSLQPDSDYLFIVNGNNGHESSRTTFSTLSQEKREQVEQEIEALEASLSEEDNKLIKLAELYLQNQLFVDAINILENLVANDSQNQEVYCTLGELYQALGRPNLAESIYQDAPNPNSECESNLIPE